MTFYRAIQIVTAAVLGALCACSPAWGQTAVYRCGNEYTNTVTEAQARNCKLVQGGNVTVVSGLKPSPGAGAGAPARAPVASGANARVNPADQKARDSDARAILESELQRALAHQAELQGEYKNGEPDKRGDEARNYQKYLDRVNDLKDKITRNDSDIAGIRRELGRLGAAN